MTSINILPLVWYRTIELFWCKRLEEIKCFCLHFCLTNLVGQSTSRLSVLGRFFWRWWNQRFGQSDSTDWKGTSWKGSIERYFSSFQSLGHQMPTEGPLHVSVAGAVSYTEWKIETSFNKHIRCWVLWWSIWLDKDEGHSLPHRRPSCGNLSTQV